MLGCVAAAGFGMSGPFLDSDLTQELEMLDVNCRALLSQSLHFGRRFAEGSDRRDDRHQSPGVATLIGQGPL